MRVWRRYLKQIHIGNFEPNKCKTPLSTKKNWLSLVSTRDGIRDTDDPRCFRFPMPRIYRRNERRHRIRMALARKIMARERVEGGRIFEAKKCKLFFVLLLLFENHKLLVECFKTNGISFVFDIIVFWCSQSLKKTYVMQSMYDENCIMTKPQYEGKTCWSRQTWWMSRQ